MTSTSTNYQDQHAHESPCKCSGNSITRSVGELVITVVRTSYNLVADLPYCIWGSLYVQGNAFPISLQNYLPEGITATSSLEAQNVTITYTNGAVSDQIIISIPDGGLINYIEALTNLNNNFMRTDFMTFNCNAGVNPPTLADSQLNALKAPGLFLNAVSGGGAKGGQVIFPLSRRQINNTQKEITEIYLRHEEVNKQTVWVHKFAYTSLSVSPLRLQFNWTVFISEMVNTNAGKVNPANIRAQRGTGPQA